MGSNRVIVCLLLWPVTAFAASVSGVVINAVNGAPIPRAHVVLGPEAGEERTYGAMTTADGRFSITGIGPGSYALTMERIGFTMPADNDAPENIPVVLAPDETKDNLRLQLVPAGAITGRVTNAEGEPVEGVSVSAEDSVGAPADITGTTDAKGRFRIGGLAPGRYRVKALPENPYTPVEMRTDGTIDLQDTPTYHHSRVLVTAGGETSGVEIRLARAPIVAVGGKVDGAPAGAFNARLFIAQPDGAGRTAYGIRPDGTFRVWRLNPGRYEIRAIWQLPGGRDFQSTPVEFEVAGANVDNLILRSIPPSDIVGRVEFQEDGAKPPGNAPAKLTLVNTGMQGGAAQVDIARDGSFQVAQLPAARYRVTPSWSNVYVASMRMGGATIDGSLLDLTLPGLASGELSVRVSAATGSVSGSVLDDRGAAAGSRVALVFDGVGGGVPPRFATAGAGGAYSFEGVAPGKYKLVAVQQADGDYVEQSGRLDDYEGLMEGIEIHAGERLSHDLRR